MAPTVAKKALREYLATLHFVHHKLHKEPISLLRSEKLAIKHLSSGVHFIGVAVFSVCVLKIFLLIFV